MMKRRSVIATILFSIGVAVYLITSGAPLRVHIVTIATELCLVATVTLFLTASSSMAHRLTGLALGVGILALVSTWLSSKAIAALNPIEAKHFAMTFAWFAIQALLLAGVVVVIDFGIAYVQSDASASAEQ
jgi:hypothetical protein